MVLLMYIPLSREYNISVWHDFGFHLTLPYIIVLSLGKYRGQIKKEGCCGVCVPAIANQELVLRTSKSGNFVTKFSWSAFRYIQISSLPPGWEINVTAIPVMTDLKWTASFQSSNILLNKIFDLCRNTHASNMMGIQSDCPHRERFGYTGDALATLPSSLLFFDGAAFYEKRLIDIQDSLRSNGGVTVSGLCGISQYVRRR